MKRISVQFWSVKYDSGLEDETDIRSILKSAVISVLKDETDIRSILKSVVMSALEDETDISIQS